MIAGKQVQRRQTFDMLWHDRVPPERASACMQHARCQGASCAFWDPFQNILNTASGVNGPQRGCEILQHVWAFILYFLACYVYGMLGYGAG